MLERSGSRAFHEDVSGVAVAGVAPRRRSLPALCTTATWYSPALPCGCNRRRGRAARRPDGDSHPLPSAPKGLPPCLRVAPDDRCAATGTPLRQKVLSPCPRPGRRRSAPTAGTQAVPRMAPRPLKPRGRSALRDHFVLWAVGRHALRGDCLCPPAFSNPLPAPGAPSLRADAPVRGLAQSAPRPSDAPLSCAKVARLPPVTSFVGDRRLRAIIFYLVAVTRPPLRSGRDTSP